MSYHVFTRRRKQHAIHLVPWMLGLKLYYLPFWRKSTTAPPTRTFYKSSTPHSCLISCQRTRTNGIHYSKASMCDWQLLLAGFHNIEKFCGHKISLSAQHARYRPVKSDGHETRHNCTGTPINICSSSYLLLVQIFFALDQSIPLQRNLLRVAAIFKAFVWAYV